MNNPTGLNHLDMLSMTGFLTTPTTRRTLRSNSSKRTNGKKVNRSERRKKNKGARKSRARNRS